MLPIFTLPLVQHQVESKSLLSRMHAHLCTQMEVHIYAQFRLMIALNIDSVHRAVRLGSLEKLLHHSLSVG